MSELNDIWKNGKGKLPEDKLMAYIEGKLSAEQQREVEAWLAEEGMESDAVEGLKELPASETKLLVNSLNFDLRHKLGKKKRKHGAIKENQWAWLAIILVVLLAVLAYVIIRAAL
jgi:anti-sigma factor RsiW